MLVDGCTLGMATEAANELEEVHKVQHTVGTTGNSLLTHLLVGCSGVAGVDTLLSFHQILSVSSRSIIVT